MFENGSHVYVQNENAHRGIVRAALVADLQQSYTADMGPQLYYVVELIDGAGWLNGTSCEDGTAYVRHLVVHADNVEERREQPAS